MLKALITGITGQDGSYLVELSLEEVTNPCSWGNYKYLDIIKIWMESRISWRVITTRRISKIHFGDLLNYINIIRILKGVKPNEVHNIVAQSHIGVSFKEPEYTADINALGTLRVLGLKDTKFYQASTSKLFGREKEIPQNENT